MSEAQWAAIIQVKSGGVITLDSLDAQSFIHRLEAYAFTHVWIHGTPPAKVMSLISARLAHTGGKVTQLNREEREEREGISGVAKAHQDAIKAVRSKIKEIFPIGAEVDVLLHGRSSTIRCVVEGYGLEWLTADPFIIHVRNKNTGKTRRISVHPELGDDVVLV